MARTTPSEKTRVLYQRKDGTYVWDKEEGADAVSVWGDAFIHKGKAYTIGTVVKGKRSDDNNIFVYRGKSDSYPPTDVFENTNPNSYNRLYSEFYLQGCISEIIVPVEFNPPPKVMVKKTTGESIIDFFTSKPHPAHTDEVFYATLIYIAVMLVAIIFKARVAIWIVATLWFFGWKNTK